MNQVAHRQFSLVPDNMADAFRLADMMAQSNLVPAHLQKSPPNCLMVIQQAVRWDVDAFALAQECYVVQGRLMHSGKLVAAVVNARGNLSRRLSYEYAGTVDNRTITVSGTIHGEDMPRTVEVCIKDAKTTNKVWQTQPDQQLMYFGARAWARRHTPELMLGVYSPEEFDDTPARPTRQRDAITGELVPALPAPAPAAQGTAHDPETGEIRDDGIPEFLDRRPTQEDEGPDPVLLFIEQTKAHIRTEQDAKALGKWWNSDEQKAARRDFELSKDQINGLIAILTARRDELMAIGTTGK